MLIKEMIKAYMHSGTIVKTLSLYDKELERR
jgi:hypothetical protein